MAKSPDPSEQVDSQLRKLESERQDLSEQVINLLRAEYDLGKM